MTPFAHAALVALFAATTVTACDAPSGRLTADGSPKIAADVQDALNALPRAEVTSIGFEGVPTFVRGELGHTASKIDAEQAPAALDPQLDRIAPVFRLTKGNLELTRVASDRFGKTHARYRQLKNGLEVVGGDLTVHIDAQGLVYAVNGTARDGAAISETPSIDAVTALDSARDQLPIENLSLGMARLTYVIASRDGALHLAWEMAAKGNRGPDPVLDIVYVDAHSGVVVERRPRIHGSLNRRVYDANSGTRLPGTLVRGEGASTTGDTAADAAYAHTGTTWQCLSTLFNRDSYNGSGAAIVSTVHYGRNYANAFWNGSQIVFGDGDGSQLGNLATAFDIIAHEIGHGVTEHSADLAYQYESGALNEAMSDIMAAACEAWADGGVNADTWKIGEDVWTPRTAGDALRYMDRPTADGMSYDYYPERYTGYDDNGGVHLNSGIGNLAYKLLSTGGSHPRNKTTQVVTGIGYEAAAKVFVRALTEYMTSSTNFEGARAATAQAALDLYDANAAASVHQAWNAVGVPGAPPVSDPGTGGSTGSSDVLENGVAVTGLSAAAGRSVAFTFEVPAGATGLTFTMSGGTGDADLYVRHGAAPTSSTYDYRPYLNGNNETVTATTAEAGTWHVMISAYQAFSGVSLTADASLPAGDTGGGSTEPDPDLLQNGVPRAGLSAAKGEAIRLTFEVPAGATDLRFEMAGGTGDADLYVRFGAEPTTSTYDFRPYKSGNTETVAPDAATEGTWYVMVNAYQAFTGVTLVASYEASTGGGQTGPANVTELEPNNDIGGAQVLSGASIVTGMIGSGTDQDVYRVDASGALSLTLEVPAGKDYDLYLFDANGNQVAKSINGAGQAESIEAAAGTWYVLVHGYNGSFSTTQAYTLTADF